MSSKLSKENWGYARVYSFLDGNPKHDNDLRANLDGKGISPAFQRHIAKLRAYSNLSPEEKAKQDIINKADTERIMRDVEARKAKFAERDAWNAEMKRRRESPIGKLVDGLVKVGDFGADVLSNVPGVGSEVADLYKSFALSGSKFRGGDKIYCGDKNKRYTEGSKYDRKGTTLECFRKGIGVGRNIMKPLEDMSLRELGAVASKLGIGGYGRMKKQELYDAIMLRKQTNPSEFRRAIQGSGDSKKKV
jgi:hypothetical protein